MPLLSIITVCLNNRDGLEKTIKSVIGQSFTDFELIVIDGNSTDGSVDLIRKHEDKINWWVSEADSGIYNAMNKGIMQAKGIYCLFLNSGDILSNKEILEDVFLQKPDEDIIYGDLIIKKGKRKYRIIKYPDILTLYHFYAPVPSLHHQASFIKRKLFDNFGLYNENLRIISDWDFFFRAIIQNNCTTKHIAKNIAIFDSFGISSGGINSEQDLKMKILNTYFPRHILSDYEDLTSFKEKWFLKAKARLTRNKFLYKNLQSFYLPIIKLMEYINYLRVKK